MIMPYIISLNKISSFSCYVEKKLFERASSSSEDLRQINPVSYDFMKDNFINRNLKRTQNFLQSKQQHTS